MSADTPATLALIVRQAPYAGRSPREQLDVALAAATLELPLEIYFLGSAIWQLVAVREPEPAALPKGLKGWSAIGGLTRARFFASDSEHGLPGEGGFEMVVDIEILDPDAMQARWRQCGRVMVL